MDARRFGLLIPVIVNRWFSPENGDDVLGWDDKQLVVGFEIDRNGVFGMKQDFVVLPQRNVGVVVDGAGNRDDSPGNGGDLGRVRKRDTALGFPFRLVFPD